MRVIKPALDEIDAQTDLNIVQVDYIKKGRAIHSIKITAEPKNSEYLLFKTPKTPHEIAHQDHYPKSDRKPCKPC